MTIHSPIANDIRSARLCSFPLRLRREDAKGWQKTTQMLRKHLRTAPLFEITNVAKYIFGRLDDGDWNPLNDIPNMAPPFPEMWFEYRTPNYPVFKGNGDGSVNPGSVLTNAGFWMSSISLSDSRRRLEALDDVDFARYIQTFLKQGMQRSVQDNPQLTARFAKFCLDTDRESIALKEFEDCHGPLSHDEHLHLEKHGLNIALSVLYPTLSRQSIIDALSPEEEGWHLDFEMFLKNAANITFGPVMRISILVKTDGSPQMTKLVGYPPGVDSRRLELEQGNQLRLIYTPVFMAIAFMHCKNVQRVAYRPPSSERQPRKALADAPLRQWTLEIEPMKRVLRVEGGERAGGSVRHAMHICRGHFKDFRQGPGLFGKHKAVYWWDSQVRGSRDQGVIVKDYTITTPASHESA